MRALYQSGLASTGAHVHRPLDFELMWKHGCPSSFPLPPFASSSPTLQSAEATQQGFHVAVMAQDDDTKRANTVLTIAQLKFKQALKKEDQEAQLPPVAIDASSQLFSHVDAVLKQNTRVNVQVSEIHAIDHMSLGAD